MGIDGNNLDKKRRENVILDISVIMKTAEKHGPICSHILSSETLEELIL